MFENRYDIAYKLLIAALLLIVLYSMVQPTMALIGGNPIEGANVTG